MKILSILPIAMLMVMFTANELYMVAQSSSEKAIDFAYDMDDAIDCATGGIDLNVCSPGIYSHDFSDEHDAFVDITGRLAQQADDVKPGDYVLRVNDDGSYVVIPA